MFCLLCTALLPLMMSTSACAGVMGGGRSVAHPLIITRHQLVGCNNAHHSASLLLPAALPAVSAIQYTPVASSQPFEKHTDAESAPTSHIRITSFSSLYPILISAISSSISLCLCPSLFCLRIQIRHTLLL